MGKARPGGVGAVGSDSMEYILGSFVGDPISLTPEHVEESFGEVIEARCLAVGTGLLTEVSPRNH